MAQWVKLIATKPDEAWSVQSVEPHGWKNQLLQFILSPWQEYHVISMKRHPHTTPTHHKENYWNHYLFDFELIIWQQNYQANKKKYPILLDYQLQYY